MYYFIEILYTIATVSSFSLEIDESVGIAFGSNIDVNNTLNFSSLEHNSDSDKAALISLRRDLTHPVTHRAKNLDPSLWYSVKSFGPAGKLSMATDESFSSESEDESNSDENFAKTPKRTHKALYKSTRVHSLSAKKYDNGRNRRNKIRGRNKRNHKQKKKYIGRQDLNKKHAAVSLYIDNMRQILYNTTHYSPYSEPLHGTYDISDLWSKQQIVKPFDESFKLPLPSNKPRDIISALGGERPKNKMIKKQTAILDKNDKPRNVPYVNKNKVDYGVKHGGVFDIINLYLKPLPKINAKPGIERMTDVKLPIPKGLIINLTKTVAGEAWQKIKTLDKKLDKPFFQNLEDKVVSGVDSMKKGVNNLFQKHIKRNIDDKDFTVKPAELFHEIENVVASDVAIGAENLWQKQMMPNVVDTIKDIFTPDEQHGTTVPGTESILETIGNGTADLWQPWIHNVRDDVKIKAFMNHIRRHNVKIFHNIDKKSKDKNWKTYIRYLAKTYENKFNEFIRDTSQHQIKSRMGPERVILNSISVSNLILTRLVNFAKDEMEKEGLLMQYSDITSKITERINEETDTILEEACTKLNVCRRKNGFMDFVGDVFTKISKLDRDKFELATKELNAAIKNTDFTSSLGADNNKKINERVTKFEKLPYMFKVGAFNVMKNIVTNRNSPLVMYGDSKTGVTHNTIAMLDVVKTLDEKVPASKENVKQWKTIKADLKSFAENPSKDIKNTMIAFVRHIKNVIDKTDKLTKSKIRNSAQIFLT